MLRRYLTVLFALMLLWPLSTTARGLNGFDLQGATVPQRLIKKGGPPRDGIPALTSPKFLDGRQAGYLKPADAVLGIVIDGQAKAYPLRVLNWHELVNDRIGERRFVISYCPLCGSGMAFDSMMAQSSVTQIKNKPLSFGVSGLLYNSDVLMYDRETASLWSQIHGAAITGKLAGSTLNQLPLSLTRWATWLKWHPHTRVLSTDTGYRRDYSRDPYAGYADSAAVYFPLANQAPKTYHPKEMVLGLKGSDTQIAFPFAELQKAGKARFDYPFNGQTVTLHWDDANQSAWVTDKQGQVIPSTLLFWFAWYAFYPDTQLFVSE